jgi:hypothetical protein
MDTNPTPEVTDPANDLLSVLNDTADKPEPVEDAAEDESAEEATDETPAEEVASDQTTEGDEEVELDGETFKVPKKLAEAVLRQKDYTQKTQAVAEEKRIVEDKRQYLEAREQLFSASIKEVAELQTLQSQLEQYAALDWQTLINDDPQQAMRLSLGRQELQAKLAEKQSNLQRTHAQFEASTAQHKAKQLEMGRAELQRRVGTLSEADRKNTWQQGVALGFTESELQSIPDPRLMHALYKAAKWDALQSAKPVAMKKVAEAPKAIRPVAPVPARQQQNNAALDRLKKTGRATELIKFL